MHSYTEVQFRNEKGGKKKIRLDRKKKTYGLPLTCDEKKKVSSLLPAVSKRDAPRPFPLLLPAFKTEQLGKRGEKKNMKQMSKRRSSTITAVGVIIKKEKKTAGKSYLHFLAKLACF